MFELAQFFFVVFLLSLFLIIVSFFFPVFIRVN